MPETPDDPYCTHCNGFGYAKEIDGYKADTGWLMCTWCRGRQRRSAEEVLANNAPKKRIVLE